MTLGDTLTASSILVGATLVALQLFLQRHWDIRKTTEEIAYRFIDPAMYQHWNAIYQPVVEQRKKWEDLSLDEQWALRALLSYFETIGILRRRRVVDPDMIDEMFHDVVLELYESTRGYLPALRSQRRSELVYIEFESMAKSFSEPGSRRSWRR